MEFDPIQGTVAHQKKRLPTQPHDTLSLGRCPTSLPFLGGASFVHTKLLLQRGAARSISLEETPRQGFGSDVQIAWGQKFLESWNTHDIFSILQWFSLPIGGRCQDCNILHQWMFVAFASFFDWSDGILPDLGCEAEPIRKGRQNSSWRFSPPLQQGTCRQFSSRKSE